MDQTFSSIRFRFGHPHWLAHLKAGQSSVVDDDGSTLSVDASDDGIWLRYSSATPATLRRLEKRVVTGCLSLAELSLDQDFAARDTQVRIDVRDPWLTVHGPGANTPPKEFDGDSLLLREELTVERFAKWTPFNDTLDGLASAAARPVKAPLQTQVLVVTALLEGLHRRLSTAPGSPVRMGPNTLALAALLTCAHYLPVGRCRDVLAALTAIEVSTGFLAAIRGRAARRLERKFQGHMQKLLASAPVLHADETPGRVNGALTYVHVACTEYLTLMHIGDRSAATIDDGGVLSEFNGVLVRDGYAGYTHLPALHAWCAAHLLRDLRSISDADPDHQTWALAMAQVLTDAHHAAIAARDTSADALTPATLAQINNHYLGAIALGRDENQDRTGELADNARRLIKRFRRYQDMILRFVADLTVPFTNNEAERTLRPVKIQQRTSGGCWRTVQGLTDFAIVQSYLDTAHKWGIDKLDALQQLFTIGAWLPPALTPG